MAGQLGQYLDAVLVVTSDILRVVALAVGKVVKKGFLMVKQMVET